MCVCSVTIINMSAVRQPYTTTRVPATQVLGIERTKGSLAVGCDADLVLVDDALRLFATYVGGELAWEASG